MPTYCTRIHKITVIRYTHSWHHLPLPCSLIVLLKVSKQWMWSTWRLLLCQNLNPSPSPCPPCPGEWCPSRPGWEGNSTTDFLKKCPCHPEDQLKSRSIYANVIFISKEEAICGPWWPLRSLHDLADCNWWSLQMENSYRRSGWILLLCYLYHILIQHTICDMWWDEVCVGRS